MTKKEKVYRLRLSLTKGIGPINFQQLLQKYSAIDLYENLSPQELSDVFGQNITSLILRGSDKIDTYRFIKYLEKSGIQFIVFGEDKYPELLKEIYDPPTVIYFKGNLNQEKLKHSISIVGTRKVGRLGEEITKKLSASLSSAGFSVISGMALGVDRIAHETALDQQGYTVAVLGGPVDQIYPPSHRYLYEKIAKKGLIISEYPPGIDIGPWSFPKRNRIISGLSLGTLVTEAPKKSGALITAHSAIEQNREVFAVPWSIDSKNGEGCNNLIKEGKAKLTQTVEDIFEEIPTVNTLKTSINTMENGSILISSEISKLENEILSVLGSTPVTSEELFDRLMYSIGEIAGALSQLEVKELILIDEKGRWRARNE